MCAKGLNKFTHHGEFGFINVLRTLLRQYPQ